MCFLALMVQVLGRNSLWSGALTETSSTCSVALSVETLVLGRVATDELRLLLWCCRKSLGCSFFNLPVFKIYLDLEWNGSKLGLY